MKMIEDLGMQYPNEWDTKKRNMAIYECPFCGTPFRTRKDHVDSGRSKSCGCHQRVAVSKMATTHGMSGTEIYNHWCSMKDRCSGTTEKTNKYYKEEGVTICDEWKNFQPFYDWAITHGYQDGLELDRVITKGNYTPENCRWSSEPVQSQNTRLIFSSNTSGYRGVSLSFGKWTSQIGWNRKLYRLGRYATPEDAARAYNAFVLLNHTSHPLNPIPCNL